MRIIPLDFEADKTPRDVALYADLQRYATAQFGHELDFSYFARAWALEHEGKVMGVTGVRVTPECPTFHVTPQTPDRDGWKAAEAGRDLMFDRLHGYFQDVGHRGSRVLVYVAPEAQRYWRRFLNQRGIVSANRYEITIR